MYAYLGLARAQHALGDLARAREFCETALSHDDSNERVLEKLVEICEQEGDSTAADEARKKLALAAG